MILNILMFALMYPTVLILCLVFKYSMGSRKKMVYGVHLPKELMDSPELTKTDQTYKRSFRKILLLIAVIPPFFFLIRHVSLQFTAWMLWFTAALVAMCIPYIKANKTTLSLKEAYLKEKDSIHDGTQQPKSQYVETTIVRTVRLPDFLIPILLSVFCCCFIFLAGPILGFDAKELSMLEVYRITIPTIAVLTFLFYLIALWMDRMRSLVISQDTSVNIAYNRAKKHIWKEAWRWCAWLNTLAVILITAGAVFQKQSFLIFMIAMILETIVSIGIMVKATRDGKEVDLLYDNRRDSNLDADNDNYWIWGMFYNNPNDKRTMVEKRFGAGTTCNMATPVGKITIIVAILALLIIPVSCVALILEDFTPMHLLLENETIVCRHIKDDYEIPLDSIQSAELLVELPDRRSKVNGMATDSMEKGKFSGSKIGPYYSFVMCDNHAFIKLESQDKTYLISGNDDEETMQIYEKLEDMIR